MKTKMSQLTKRLDDFDVKVEQLHKINQMYLSDVKLNRQLLGRLKTELQAAQDAARKSQVEISYEKAQTAKLDEEKKEIIQKYEHQRLDMETLLHSLQSAEKEVIQLRKSNEKLTKQWDEAVTAMTRRDETFQTVQQSKNKLREQLNGSDETVRVLKSEKMDLERRIQTLETGIML
jgi:DNA repair exonuclease SbcCD ATPase subunit